MQQDREFFLIPIHLVSSIPKDKENVNFIFTTNFILSSKLIKT